MRIRLHEGIDETRIPNFARFRRAVERDDFAAADMGKIGDNLYRARLGKSARLLFSFYRHEERVECLVLEYLPNHEYEKARFLARGVDVDEARIQLRGWTKPGTSGSVCASRSSRSPSARPCTRSSCVTCATSRRRICTTRTCSRTTTASSSTPRATSWSWTRCRTSPEKGIRQLYRNHYMIYELSSPNAVLKDTERYGVDHRTVFGWTPLMVAAKIGNATLVNALLERGADRRLVSDHGLDAGQILLEAATTDPKLARRVGGTWAALAPDSLSIQVDGRLIKLGGHLMGLFLLNLMFARFYRDLGPFASEGWAIDAVRLEHWVAELPEAMLPARRKRRPYISSVLSGNEVDRDAPYNRKLFKRVSRGNYIINPALKIRLADEWVGVHELLRLEDLGIEPVAVPGIPGYSEAQ